MTDINIALKEIKRLEAEIRKLKAIITEMAAAMKLLTEKDERAREFIARIDELSTGLMEDAQNEIDEIKDDLQD